MITTTMPSDNRVTAIVDLETRLALERRATLENRSVSNLVATLIKKEVDSWEMTKEELAFHFLHALAKGEPPQNLDFAKLAQALEIPEEKLLELCNRLFPDR